MFLFCSVFGLAGRSPAPGGGLQHLFHAQLCWSRGTYEWVSAVLVPVDPRGFMLTLTHIWLL